jgi:hypothetical protein
MSTYSLRPLRRAIEVRGLGLLLLAPLVFACAPPWRPPPEQPPPSAELMERLAEERARDRHRIASLENQIERLRADREVADSEVRAGRSRTVAVSMLAEAQIFVDQAAKATPWNPAAIDEARLKLVDAERLLLGGDPAAAVYFASRGRRIAETLLNEADLVNDSPQTRFVLATRLNLRSGPATAETVVGVLEAGTPVFEQRRQGAWVRVQTLDGEPGWVHASLIRGSQPEAWGEAELESSVAEADRPARGGTNASKPAQLEATAPGRVARASFATDVVHREPVDSVVALGSDHRHVFYFSELRGMQGRTVTHRWEHDDQVVAEIPFAVGGARWRVHSRKNLGTSLRGEWRVSVVDESGEVLRTDRLEYEEITGVENSALPAAPSP